MAFLRKHKKLAIFLVSTILLYALVGFIVIPLILEAKLPSTLSEQLGKPVVVKDIQLNPFALSLNIHGFEIQERGQNSLIGFSGTVRELSIIVDLPEGFLPLPRYDWFCLMG